MKIVRTRFAPSPTGFIHLGNIRSALYPWAFAKSQQGVFVLRIEDTDLARSTQEATDVILQGLEWLGLTPDEGPFYQMERMEYYKETLQKMAEVGTVYPCYMSEEELEALRERQIANKEKPRYDGTWRPEEGKTLPAIPKGVKPVWRFKNPLNGVVAWEDKVKGRIEISNTELDDFVVARKDLVPTYNFSVVLDDIAMEITHVIRGDDHINNTPRQINLYEALGADIPVFAHLPTVLNEEGEKMSKRNGAKSVIQYKEEGFLPEAVINYLARLGWSHGDDEIFTVEQLVEWFNLDHLGKSAGQYDEAKLRWVNAQHIKMADDDRLAKLVSEFLQKKGIQTDERLPAICALFKARSETLQEMSNAIVPFYQTVEADPKIKAKFLTEEIKPAVLDLAKMLETCDWEKTVINDAFKTVLKAHELKMPQLGAPVRVLMLGEPTSPSIDEVLALIPRDVVIARLRKI